MRSDRVVGSNPPGAFDFFKHLFCLYIDRHIRVDLSQCFCFVLVYNKSLNDWSLGEQ